MDVFVSKARELFPQIPDGERFSWNFRQKDLMRKFIKDGGARNFLQWPIVHETLYTGYTENAAKERELIPSFMLPVSKDPAIGNPTGLKSPEGASGTYIRQLLVALLVNSHLAPIRSMDTLFEFGGGYGALAVVLKRLGFAGLHYVYDFPALHLLREWYLGEVGASTISLTSPQDMTVNVFVSVCALDEAPLETRSTVLESVKAKYYLIWMTRNYYGVDNYTWFMNWISSKSSLCYEIDIPNKNQCCLLIKNPTPAGSRTK